jgi:pimeloyl-ACP methyl ester carboxylesterase
MPLLTVAPGIDIAFEVAGQGLPIVLVHGFASSRGQNWKSPGWVAPLVEAGRQVIMLDVRGHGESSKPHDARAYDEGELASDVIRLMDHLGHATADVMGYSMGGFITMRALHDFHHRVRKAIVAGVGENYYGRGRLETDAIAAGLRAQSATDIQGVVPRQFRLFAEQGKNDLEALALCMTRPRHSYSAGEMTHVPTPTLIVIGENDTTTGPVGALANVIAGAQVVTVPKRDHMTTVGDKVYKSAVLSFLAEP